jgi:uncharacterized damage-inducible protein DinB
MEAGLARFLAVIDRLSDEQMLAPADAAGWNVRDHVAHLAAWADGIAALLRREDRWAAMGLAIDNPESDDLDVDALNAQIAAQHTSLAPGEARAWLVAAHQRVAAALDGLGNDDLSAPYGRFVAPFNSEAGRPIYSYILSNTADHYDEHLPWLPGVEAEPR